MRLGLTLTTDPAASFGDAIKTAVAAEQAGFATIYLTERHFVSGAAFANPYAVAAAISGELQYAWLGVRPIIGLDHPLRLVEQTNLLHVLTRGRCVVVIDDDLDSAQYDAFGLPTPRNGLFEHLVEQMLDAWTFHFEEDGQPLEFQSGTYAARMAGRIMPAPWRQTRPLLAREVAAEDAALDAARRGWPIQLRGVAPDRIAALIASYRETLTSAGHSESTVQDCLHWLVVSVDVTDLPADRLTPLLRDVERHGASEVRLDPPPGVSVDELAATLKLNPARSA